MNEFLCVNGHQWSSGSNKLAEACPWCEAEQLKPEIERLKEYLREFESAAKAALDGYRLVSEDHDAADKIEQMSRVLNQLHAKGGIVAYSEGEWFVIGARGPEGDKGE